MWKEKNLSIVCATCLLDGVFIPTLMYGYEILFTAEVEVEELDNFKGMAGITEQTK